MRPLSRSARRALGFSLLEVMLSLGIFAVLIITVFSVTTETSAFVADTDIDGSIQAEGNRIFFRLAEILRKIGWNTSGGVTYPRVLAGGNELEFRILADMDLNGYAFSFVTGELEWGPRVFTVRRNPANNTLMLYEGATPAWTFGRYVESINFATYLEDGSLSLKELRVTILTRRINRDGFPFSYTLSESICMRN